MCTDTQAHMQRNSIPTYTNGKAYLQRDPSTPAPPSIQPLNLSWPCDSLMTN